MGDISSDGLSGGMFPDDEDSEIRVRRPQLFGDYELVRRLRVGGMAELYRARREVHKNEQVVIKRLLLSLTDEAEYVSMFLDEAQLAIRLEHPNIVRTFDVGQVDDTPFMAMELIDGQDLSTVIRRARELGRTVPVSVACHIATCVAGALSYAHELTDERGRALGVIHRDLSPHNILVSFGGSVKLIDFGVAKSTAQTMKTRAGMFKGKHGYLSPEQATGAALDARSDVFSLGICLYEMITGERLFAGSSDFSTLQRVRAAQIPDLRGERPDVPEALVEIVDKALARAPEERFESAQAFADALDGFMHSLVADDGEQELVAFLGELFAKEIAGGVDAEEGEEVDLSTGLSGFDDLEPVSVVSEFDVLPDDGLAVLEDAQAPSPVRPPPPPPPGAARAHAPLPPPPSTSGELPAPIVGGGATAGLGGLTPDGAPTPGGASGETDAEAQPLGDLAGGAGDPPESAASDFRTLDDEPETFEPLDQEVVDAEFVDVESSELGDVEAASATDLGAEQASSPDAQLEARADGLGTGDAKPGAGVLPGEAPDGDLDGGDYSDESVRRDSHDDVAGATPGFARDHSAAQGPDCQPVDEPDLLAESVGHGVRAHGSPSSSDEALFEAASLDEAFEAAFEEAVSQDAPPEDAPPDVAALEGALPPEPAGGSPHEGVSQATSPDAAARGGRGSETASGASQEASLDEASLEEASLEEASLEEASLEEASLDEASLEEASLDEAMLEEASAGAAASSAAGAFDESIEPTVADASPALVTQDEGSLEAGGAQVLPPALGPDFGPEDRPDEAYVPPSAVAPAIEMDWADDDQAPTRQYTPSGAEPGSLAPKEFAPPPATVPPQPRVLGLHSSGQPATSEAVVSQQPPYAAVAAADRKPPLSLLAGGGALLVGAIVVIVMAVSDPTPSVVHLRTEPRDAAVTVDGTPVSGIASPFVITDLTPNKKHRIEVSKEGHRPWAATISLDEGQVLELPAVALQPDPPETSAAEGPPSGPPPDPVAEVPVAAGEPPAAASPGAARPAAVAAKPAPKATGSQSAKPRIPTPIADPGRGPRPVAAAAPKGPKGPKGGLGSGASGAKASSGNALAKGRPAVVLPGGGASLRINSRPWSVVFVDGKRIGNTPQMRIPVTPGTHQVELRNDAFQLSKKLVVDVPKGGTVTRIVDLAQ